MSVTLAYRACDPTPVQQFLKYGVAQEGLVDAATFIRDLVGHSFRTIKVNFSNIKKDYVQSDFQQYCSKNKAKLNLFLNNPTRKLVDDTFLPIPDGMVGKYTEVTGALTSFLTIPFSSTSKSIVELADTLENIVSDTKSNPKTKIKNIEDKIKTSDIYSVILPGLNLGKILPTFFNKGRVGSTTVGEQFSSKEEIKAVMAGLITCGRAYKDFVEHKDYITKIEDSFKTLTDRCSAYIPELKGSDKSKFISVMYTFIKDVALYCDFYGVAVNEALRVEHKFMLCLTQMCEVAKNS